MQPHAPTQNRILLPIQLSTALRYECGAKGIHRSNLMLQIQIADETGRALKFCGILLVSLLESNNVS